MAVELSPGRSSVERKAPPSGLMSYEEFLHLYEGVHAEWIAGEVTFLSPFNHDHQDISGFLTAIIRLHIEESDLGEILGPYQMRLHNSERGREPDLLFIATENLSRMHSSYVEGPADLAIEIVSPDSILRDRGEKYAEYELEGVPEYWVIDPMSERADFYQLGSDGRYERVKPDANGIYRSRVLVGFWLKVAWLWLHPMPKLKDVMKQWEER